MMIRMLATDDVEELVSALARGADERSVWAVEEIFSSKFGALPVESSGTSAYAH